MNIKLTLLALAVASSLTMTGFAGGPGQFDGPANSNKGTMSLDVGMNFASITPSGRSSVSYDLGLALGLAFDYNVYNNIRLGLNLSGYYNTLKPGGQTYQFWQVIGLVMLRYDFKKMIPVIPQSLVPFVVAGLGYGGAITKHPEVQGQSGEVAKGLAYRVGFGADYYFNQTISLGGAYKFTGVSETVFEGDDGKYSAHNNSIVATIGLHF